MRIFRWLLASYLLLAFLACVLVYLGDAHDVPIGRWADANEYLLYVAIPFAVLLVIPGGLAVDGGNLAHMLMVFAAAAAEVAVFYAIVARFCKVRRPPHSI
jgi:phosphatidylglycerophosphate synthase